jgi:hypothetical protein
MFLSENVDAWLLFVQKRRRRRRRRRRTVIVVRCR